MGHNYIGTEHILLALLVLEDGAAWPLWPGRPGRLAMNPADGIRLHR